MRLDGVAPKKIAASNDLEAADGKSIRDESLRINRTVDNGVANVYVYLAESPDGRPFAAPQQAFRLRTDGKAFSPCAGIMRVGQALTLRNDSQISSNFHFFPNRDNPMINHVVQPGGQANLQARFAVPERTPFEIRSDRYSWMREFTGPRPSVRSGDRRAGRLRGRRPAAGQVCLPRLARAGPLFGASFADRNQTGRNYESQTVV